MLSLVVCGPGQQHPSVSAAQASDQQLLPVSAVCVVVLYGAFVAAHKRAGLCCFEGC